ncbi:hypothetical protein A2V49_03750 [candidate division WWE3 bacterium RBG_19FT_COMBO_34_6]|uniref:Uncharacterized protein n=1 Tax=candidate division WWE3 bacterium RBG_19FT_COMBO_34_6 TaxID=1802612 RepID=A0A1F4UKU7_UNCKA|nr:MAG: hypothetical protein A2V49_03750 [candidate division WWE3 bacterium RBG_19FT_COMBO_34_6]
MREDEAVSLARKMIKENIENPSGRPFAVILDEIKITKIGYEIRSIHPAGWWILISFFKEIFIFKSGDGAKKRG